MIRLVGASVQGLSHERLGIPCQDSHLCLLLSNEVALLAVADGAGSASHSHIGSQVAIQTVHALFLCWDTAQRREEPEWKSQFWNLFQNVKSALEQEAARQGIEVREMATTLLVALSFPDQVLFAQVGDGALVLRDNKGELHTVTPPRTSEYCNETDFVTGLLSEEEMHLSRFEEEASHIALFTDGLEPVALNMSEATPHAPFFTPLFQFVAHAESSPEAKPQLEQFLRSPRLRDRVEDDLTLVLMARRG